MGQALVSSASQASAGAIADPDVATEVLRRRIDAGLRVTRIRRLPGGNMNHVVEWRTDGEPASLVAKFTADDPPATLRQERDSLELYRRLGTLPVPRPLGWIERDPALGGSLLLMETLPGHMLSDARLSEKGRARLQQDLAEHLITLHSHGAETFGVAGEAKGEARWLDVFGPMLERQWHAVRPRLASRVRPMGDTIVRRLEQWLTRPGPPTLTHGDLWTSNILVDDRHPDRPAITGFIDSVARYLDREYELAYLRLFNTADPTCFERYAHALPLREGFERRFRVYWLHTALMHVQSFGVRYRPMCERLVRELGGRG